jgi:hypothetical protein
MISSKWDTGTGEVLVRCDAQTAHELVKMLIYNEARLVYNEARLPAELRKLRDALRHTLLTSNGRDKPHA